MKKNTEMLFKDNGIRIHPQMKVIGMLYVTDYSKIELAEGQRPLTANGLKNVGESIHNHGVLTSGIAVRNPNKNGFYVIPDGQTRIHGARKNNVDMVFTLVEPDCSINDLMIILNTTQYNWNAEAYLNNGIVIHKNKDMQFLESVWDDTGLSLTALYEIYSHNLSSAKAKDSFEKGTWIASTKDLGNRVIKYAEELHKYMSFSLKARFLQGFVICVAKPRYNQKQMIAQAKRFPNHIHAVDTPNEYRDMLNFLYNHLIVEEDQLYIA